jgi:hypothetical protein
MKLRCKLDSSVDINPNLNFNPNPNPNPHDSVVDVLSESIEKEMEENERRMRDAAFLAVGESNPPYPEDDERDKSPKDGM